VSDNLSFFFLSFSIQFSAPWFLLELIWFLFIFSSSFCLLCHFSHCYFQSYQFFQTLPLHMIQL
jgi:hypothetical protein